MLKTISFTINTGLTDTELATNLGLALEETDLGCDDSINLQIGLPTINIEEYSMEVAVTDYLLARAAANKRVPSRDEAKKRIAELLGEVSA